MTGGKALVIRLDDDIPGKRRNKRIITNSEASKIVFMMNVPVAGEQDFWEHVDEIVMSDNPFLTMAPLCLTNTMCV